MCQRPVRREPSESRPRCARGFRFVTCLCVTRNRRQWIPKAIACFQSQTYPHREMLILADGGSVRDLVPADNSIRLLELEGAAQIGEKRNLGCDRALGEIICHWDDDDWSAPGRIADQVSRLVESKLAVTGYRSMRFTDGSRWWLYQGTPLFALGTSLCYRKDWWKKHPFRYVQIGEDNHFVTAAGAERQIVTSEAGELMWATVHSTNTSPRSLSGSAWKLLA
jgi:glycosyltransferase involved in cell wall biosynthesis